MNMSTHAGLAAVGLVAALVGSTARAASLREPGAVVFEASAGHRFTEGPAADAAGDVWFSDAPLNLIHRWSATGGGTVWRTNTGGANGLYFDARGRLLACEGDRKRVVAYGADGAATVLADAYAGKPLNKPNDLWVAPGGGLYFSDPLYGNLERTQDAEALYYLPPTGPLVRVISDFVKPNGLIGTPDGKMLYATDIGAGQTWTYRIAPDGTLSGKQLLCKRGSDGMTLDERGNVYLTDGTVAVFAPDGTLLEEIQVPQRPANVTFGGADRRTLFITAGRSVYTLRMQVAGSL